MCVGLLGERERRAQLLDAQPGEPVAHVHARFQRLTLHDARDEAGGEGVARDVGYQHNSTA